MGIEQTLERMRKMRLPGMVQAYVRDSQLEGDIDYQHPRGLKRRQFQELLRCDWIRKGHNVLIIGPTGVGKTFLHVLWAMRLAERGYQLGITAFRHFSVSLTLPRAMGNISSFSKHLRKLSC